MCGLGQGRDVSAEWAVHGSHLQGELRRMWLLVYSKFSKRVIVSLSELAVSLIFKRKNKMLEACPIQTTRKITLTVADSNHLQKLMVRKTLVTWTVDP